VLSVIRVAQQPGFDRVVFELDGPVPAFSVTSVPAVVEDPRGRTMPVAGTAFLQVRLKGATLDDSTRDGDRSYTGPTEVSTGLAAVKQVVVSGDFESLLSFGVGLAGRRAFRVTALTSPSRIVLDVARS
jgi:hypothetical protein